MTEDTNRIFKICGWEVGWRDIKGKYIAPIDLDVIFDGKSNINHTHDTSGGGITLGEVKADTDIYDALIKKHSSGSDNQDLSNLVVKETGKSLVLDTEISKIHTVGSEFSGLAKITVGISQPEFPQTGDLWIDIN